MLVDDPQMLCAVRQLVSSLAVDPATREDLIQESLIRLWKAESETPGQTRSWYLQNCRFCALHWLALGRSVDSPKRATATNRVPIDGADDGHECPALHSDREPLEAVSFHDLIDVLSRSLTHRERTILQGLANGLRLREASRDAKVSYPTALKCRRRIAALVTKLGIPEQKSPPNKFVVAASWPNAARKSSSGQRRNPGKPRLLTARSSQKPVARMSIGRTVQALEPAAVCLGGFGEPLPAKCSAVGR